MSITLREQPINPQTVVCALIGMVNDATPKGGNEADVTTLISRPMWRMFNRALGHPPDVKPTGWLGIGKTHRVYGSETIIVGSEAIYSVSFPTPKL